MRTIGKKKFEWFPLKSEADVYAEALRLMGYANARVEHSGHIGWYALRDGVKP